jgi:hypothetical protein
MGLRGNVDFLNLREKVLYDPAFSRGMIEYLTVIHVTVRTDLISQLRLETFTICIPDHNAPRLPNFGGWFYALRGRPESPEEPITAVATQLPPMLSCSHLRRLQSITHFRISPHR